MRVAEIADYFTGVVIADRDKALLSGAYILLGSSVNCSVGDGMGSYERTKGPTALLCKMEFVCVVKLTFYVRLGEKDDLHSVVEFEAETGVQLGADASFDKF